MVDCSDCTIKQEHAAFLKAFKAEAQDVSRSAEYISLLCKEIQRLRDENQYFRKALRGADERCGALLVKDWEKAIKYLLRDKDKCP